MVKSKKKGGIFYLFILVCDSQNKQKNVAICGVTKSRLDWPDRLINGPGSYIMMSVVASCSRSALDSRL